MFVGTLQLLPAAEGAVAPFGASGGRAGRYAGGGGLDGEEAEKGGLVAFAYGYAVGTDDDVAALYGLDAGELDYEGFMDADEAVGREAFLQGLETHEREDRLRPAVKMDFYIVLESLYIGDFVQLDLLEAEFGLDEDAAEISVRGRPRAGVRSGGSLVALSLNGGIRHRPGGRAGIRCGA